jgi:hypothetical protein
MDESLSSKDPGFIGPLNGKELQYLASNRIAIVSSSWTAEQSVAMRFGRPQFTLILLTRHQIHIVSLRIGCILVAPWRSVL